MWPWKLFGLNQLVLNILWFVWRLWFLSTLWMSCFFPAGFSELSQADQLILIKTGFFEIWLTRLARMFNRNDNVLLFEDGSLIAREELDIVYNVSTGVPCEYWCTVWVLVYRVSTGVQHEYWCNNNNNNKLICRGPLSHRQASSWCMMWVLVYNVDTSVQCDYWCTVWVLIYMWVLVQTLYPAMLDIVYNVIVSTGSNSTLQCWT